MMNVNAAPPCTCSPKLKQTPPPPQSVLLLSVWLSGFTHKPRRPSSNREPGLWQPYQRFKNQRESDKTNRQQREMRNTPPACPVPVPTTAAAPITFRKTVRFMCVCYRLCSGSYFFVAFTFWQITKWDLI